MTTLSSYTDYLSFLRSYEQQIHVFYNLLRVMHTYASLHISVFGLRKLLKVS